MPSTLLAHCIQPLADAWLQIREVYEAGHPGVELFVTCTYRPPEEQFTLFKIGRYQRPDGSWVIDEDPRTFVLTQLDGYQRRSKHNSHPAAALDFAIKVGGKVLWDLKPFLTLAVPLAEIAAEHGLVWGGTWGEPPHTVWDRVAAKQFVDGPHFEWRD